MQHIPFVPAAVLAALILSGCGSINTELHRYQTPEIASQFLPGEQLKIKGYSSGISVDRNTNTATVADDGNRVTGIVSHGITGSDLTDPVLRFFYRLNSEDRTVSFRRGDFAERGNIGIGIIYPGGGGGQDFDRGFRSVRPPLPMDFDPRQDSPYDLTSYGWWEYVGLPHVAVAGFIADRSQYSEAEYKNFQHRHYFVTGPGTSSDSMPVTGTASYAGVFRAQAYRQVTNNPDLYHQRMTGAVNLFVNFEASTLAGSVNDVTGWTPGEVGQSYFRHWVTGYEPWATSSFAIEGTISDTGFTGTLAGSDSDPTTPDASSARGYAGNIDGGFFGPGAENLGAAVTATRDLSGTENDRALFGYIVGARE